MGIYSWRKKNRWSVASMNFRVKILNERVLEIGRKIGFEKELTLETIPDNIRNLTILGFVFVWISYFLNISPFFALIVFGVGIAYNFGRYCKLKKIN
ncbi:MAG TPA: hypothetical protein HA306_01190 [Methanosarcina sp.]|nr:hypothetical protein [Methanosarcina sp.]